jgi:hypothetical protein
MSSGITSASVQRRADNGQLDNNLTSKLTEELQKEREDHQKTKEALQAAEDEIRNLSEQVQNLRTSNQRASQHFIQQANLKNHRSTPQRRGSNLVHNSAEDDDIHHTKTSRTTFASSKAPRPLSLSGTAVPQSRSLTSSHNITPPRLPLSVASGLGSNVGSTAASNRTATSRESSPGTSGDPSAALNPANPIDQTRPASAESSAVQNVNTAVKKSYQQLRHKFSNGIMGKGLREEKINTAQSAPMLPAVPPTVPLQRGMSRVLIDSNKRRTGDSGYGGSLELNRIPRS